MAGVRLVGVTKRFGNTVAVAKTDLDIKDGEFMVLVGPSGCGKSTTLRMIAGLEMPTEGEIYIGERNVTHVEPKDRDIAMVFQNYALYPHMKVYDNMAFGLRLRKVPKKEIDQRVREVAEMLGIAGLLDRYPRQLSGGQRQRVALGRAIVRHPQVFLMDEPLSNLDAKLRVQTRAELIKLHQRLKTTVIYVTHDQVEAMTMGTRIVVMKDGVVQQVGTPQEIYNRPHNMFVAGFIGSPSMNFIKGKLAIREGSAYFTTREHSIRLANLYPAMTTYQNKEIVLGIRPEDITIARDEEEQGGFVGTTEIIENIGAEAILYIRTLDEIEIVIRLNASQKLPIVGQKVKLQLSPEKIHLFDPTTGVSILNQN